MEIMEFAYKAQSAMHEILGEDFDVTIQTILKNNGINYTGLSIRKGKEIASPTIYLEPFCDAYDNGMSFSDLMNRLVSVYQDGCLQKDIDMHFFMDFEKVREGICFKLINTQMNEDLLKEIPHMQFLDLSEVYYYRYQEEELGDGSILIHNNHMEIWGVSTEQLHLLALQNAQRDLPAECKRIGEVLQELMCHKNNKQSCVMEEEIFPETSMMVLTNHSKFFGASVMKYPGVLEEIAKKAGENLLILPSSIHELILIPDDGSVDANNMQEMVMEINRTELERGDLLSNHVYLYDMQKDEVEILA